MNHRRPLRSQITLPIGALIMTSVMATSLINAFVAANRAQRDIDGQIQQIVETLRDPRFPLVDTTLQQVSRLSGAEYVVTGSDAQVLASSFSMGKKLANPRPNHALRAPSKATLRAAATSTFENRTYYHVAFGLPTEYAGDDSRKFLHLLYPQDRYRAAWREAMIFPLVTGSLAVFVVFGLSYQIARRITQPIERFRQGVSEITSGRFAPIPIPQRDDEVRDLVVSINLLAKRLEEYELEVRSNERLQTLGQLGAGIAHQLRNAVTGCRLALDLHARDCQLGSDQSLGVAKQQLALMEEYLNRFLSLGKVSTFSPETVELGQVIDTSVQLIRPMANHTQVQLHVKKPPPHITLEGDRHLLCQLLINLLMNAIEAVAKPNQIANQDQTLQVARQVQLDYSISEREITLFIIDNGLGPSELIRDVVFEPLKTDKPEGTGLGLSVARDIVKQHSGSICWERTGDLTRFQVQLPRDRDNDETP